MKKTPAKESRGLHGFDPLPPRGRPVSNVLIDKLREEAMPESEAIDVELDTDFYLEEISRQLTARFGDLNEGRTLASMREVLYQRFGVEVTAPGPEPGMATAPWKSAFRPTRGKGTRSSSSRSRTTSAKEDLDRINKILCELRDFFPGYEGKKLYGILAAVYAPEEVREKVQEGIYLARVHDGHFELQVPEGFLPKAF